MSVAGGPALPVVVSTGNAQGGPAIPVYGYTSADIGARPVMGGPALPVKVLSASDLRQNGGKYYLSGRPQYLPVYEVSAGSRPVEGGPVIPIYVMGGSVGVSAPVIPAVTSYYVDATGGDDSKDGLSMATAWKTVGKVNAATLLPGNQVLFKCGETFRAPLVVPSSGAAGNPITFGKYGVGANPVFDLNTAVTGWALDSGAIYKVTDGNGDYQVWQDGARFIYKPDKASMIAGSFAKVGTTLYVWCSDSGDPAGHLIERATDANQAAIKLNGKSHLVFDGIDVFRSGIASHVTNLAGSDDILIKNSTVSWSGIRSILIGTDGHGASIACSNITIRNCIGHDDLDHSFWIGHGNNLIVEDCETYNSGKDVTPNGKLYPNTGAQQHFVDGILVSAEAVDSIVRRNYVHDIYGGNAILDERSGGAKSTRTVIERNHVDTTTGGAKGIFVEGINTTVRNNWINAGSQSAIMLNNGPTVPVFYHNTIVSASGSGHSFDTNSQPGAIIKNNIFVRAGATNRYISVPATAKTGMVVDYNLYYGASTGRWFWGPTEYTTLATWVAASGQDANSPVVADPVFVVANTDVHLQTTSPAKNAGVAGLGVTDDYDGNPRPYPATLPDIGAFEYQGA